jgi:queuine tRNA-ribosyltransferase
MNQPLPRARDALDCEVVETRKGARAIRDRITGELMHPVIGPLIEPQQLYIGPSRLEPRLRAEAATTAGGEAAAHAHAQAASQAALVVLDVGLGAGSNAIAAWRLSESLPPSCRKLEIVSFDRSLAAIELALQPQHAASFGLEGAAGAAARALLTHGRTDTARSAWRLNAGELLPALAREPEALADVVFWDPFSPRANPGLWTVAAFTALRRLCRSGTTVHTYSGATAVRTALLLAGFAVGRRDDVGEGRQNTCAATDVRQLDTPLDGRFLDRLTRSSAGFPVDAPADALQRLRTLPQFAS